MYLYLRLSAPDMHYQYYRVICGKLSPTLFDGVSHISELICSCDNFTSSSSEVSN